MNRVFKKGLVLQLFAMPRRTKQAILAMADLVALPLLFVMALHLRYDDVYPPILSAHPFSPVWIGCFGVFIFAVTGVYRAVVRAFDERFLQDLMLAASLMAGVLLLLAAFGWVEIPRSTPVVFSAFAFVWVWSTRSAIRKLVRMMAQLQAPVIRVAIYGAGGAGRQVIAALRASPEYFPVAFFDDDKSMVGTTVQGLRVHYGRDFRRLYKQIGVDEVLVAMPSSSRAVRRAVIEHLEPCAVHVRTLPAITQLVNGQVSISDIREVDIADLLGRDQVPPSQNLLGQNITGKCVMVTGAGGSIGSELCRQIIATGPQTLLLWELSEFALYQIESELKALRTNIRIVPVLGSVLHQERMTRIMRHYGVDTIYHAAAYKHVPIVEWNPFEGVLNNAAGTLHAGRAAIAAGVSTFVLISTDKAVRPTNVMGASKRMSEMFLQALAAEPDTGTRFCMVRFGNVLGSSGSVVPLFREQIARGGPVTVTHPEVTRFFMTIPEASQLVIQAGAMGAGGDVFVLDMGESVKIVDLARKMIRLSGMSSREDGSAEKDGDIEIVFSGLRPGEKLYEELLIGDNVSGTDHPRIMRAMEETLPYEQLEAVLQQIYELARVYDVAGLKALLQSTVVGYVADMSEFGLMAPDALAGNVIPLRREGREV